MTDIHFSVNERNDDELPFADIFPIVGVLRCPVEGVVCWRNHNSFIHRAGTVKKIERSCYQSGTGIG
jgi:hypothetical protein